MRDLIVMGLVLAGALASLRYAWVGVMLWTWVSILNPHRFTYGFALNAPVAAIAAASTLVALMVTRERDSPFKGPEVVVFLIFSLWMTLSWLVGLDPEGDYQQWNKVMKVYLMIFVALALLRSKKHIFALIWVCAGSLALLGVKGGVFTVLTAGSYRVWGPPGTFIEDNNEFAVALIMTIPLMRFLQLQVASEWGRRVMGVCMLLMVFSSIGSHSRGALLAISAMGMLLWWRGGDRLRMALVMVPLVVVLLTFMPQEWFERMGTMERYQDDSSAMGRVSAWWMAWNMSKERFFGVGFNAVRPELFVQYSPYPDQIQAAHSIYFQVLGHHGWFGLVLWLSIWVLTWRSAGWLRKNAGLRPETLWCAQLGGLIQVSLIGYAVGGAFLSLAYFDLPYNLMIMVVLTRTWVRKQAWQTEPAPVRSFWSLPGLGGPKQASPG